MTRPKGSTNKPKMENSTQNIEQKLNTIEKELLNQVQKQSNTYEEAVAQYIEGFVGKLFSDGIVKTISAETLQLWLNNPDTYYKEINGLMAYYYITDGSIFQLYDLVNTLPSLNYKIDSIEQNKSNEKNLAVLNKTLKKVKHKPLTRSILTQLVSSGTIVTLWLGDKKSNPYLFIFDELRYVFPRFRRNGEWVAVVDMEWFRQMKEKERQNYFDNLNPYITENMYNSYLNDTQTENVRYIELPQERTTVLQTHTLYRNQRLGIPWGTASLFDQFHKQKMKDLEKAIANKIINAIAVLQIGSKDNEAYSNLKLKPNIKKKVYSGVKNALEKNASNGVTCIAIPEFAELTFPDLKSDGLNPNKYESINGDITSANGISGAILNGTGSNYASSKINLDILYKRIGVLLENIEEDVYGKLFNLVLPNGVADNFSMVYDKDSPLTNSDKLKTLQTLENQGYAIKPILDLLGIDYQNYINQSKYEIETLKLRDIIKPPLNGNVMSGNGDNGSPTNDNTNNDNTVKTKTDDGNSTPRANT